MISLIKVYLNSKDKGGAREIVDAELVKEYSTYMYVKLPDGNVIKRKKNRDLVEPSTK